MWKTLIGKVQEAASVAESKAIGACMRAVEAREQAIGLSDTGEDAWQFALDTNHSGYGAD
jgi:hypothetical protein